MSLGMDYGDEYEDYLAEVANADLDEDRVPMSFDEWLQDQEERALWRYEDSVDDIAKGK